MPDLTLNRNEHGKNDMLNNDPAKKKNPEKLAQFLSTNYHRALIIYHV